MGRNQKYSKIGEKLLGRLSALLICRLTIRDHESTNQKPAFVFAVGIAGLGIRKYLVIYPTVPFFIILL